MRITQKLLTYYRLGLPNLFAVLHYRLEKKLNHQSKKMPVKAFNYGRFFNEILDESSKVESNAVLGAADQLLAGQFVYFSHKALINKLPPKWRHTLDGFEVSKSSQHWSSIQDFNPKVGDIKTVWESSRFDWLLVLTRAYKLSGEQHYLDAINSWLQDWCKENPANGGPNWKCGQEASFRMMQTLMSAYLLGEHKKPEPMLVEFVVAHSRRIVPTLRYAMAQDNNHGTSEAAALFIAGYWLASVDAVPNSLTTEKEILKFQSLGRKWLENRTNKLVMEDGSFSQHSVNYHRVMLDTMSMAEFWRVELDVEPFSDRFYQRVKTATAWLYTMTNPATGDAPNLGANDGARLFVLTDTDYRDYRPSVQWAAALFFNTAAYGEGPWNDQLRWLGMALPTAKPEQGTTSSVLNRHSQLFDQGGYCFLHNAQSDLELFIRYPRFRFRPSHADAMHLDLWWQGNNIIRDGGTFSYNPKAQGQSDNNCGKQWLDYFPGTESHSTIQFDKRDQMPRISRFLYGNWLKPDFVEQIQQQGQALLWTAQYTDSFGASHKRSVRLKKELVVVTDDVKGFKDNAILRWRLCPGEWQVKGNKAIWNGIEIAVTANQAPAVLRLVEGYESRYYNEMTPLHVLETEVTYTTEFITTFTFPKS